jgi:hypothetical protein
MGPATHKYVKGANGHVGPARPYRRLRRPLVLLALLVGSYAVGFTLVISFHRPDTTRGEINLDRLENSGGNASARRGDSRAPGRTNDIDADFKDEAQRLELKKLKRSGRTVDVVKDNVRVRNRPGDGLVLGKVSSHHQVTLIKHRDEWCRVITPNNHQGWMICDALAL